MRFCIYCKWFVVIVHKMLLFNFIVRTSVHDFDVYEMQRINWLYYLTFYSLFLATLPLAIQASLRFSMDLNEIAVIFMTVSWNGLSVVVPF